MPALSRGQENTESIVNWFITVNGVSTDAYEVGFRIFDIVGGVPGTQIYPVTPGEYEDVTNAPGKFAVGAYYAYNNGDGNGWTPELTAQIGTHRIEWRWKISSGAPYQAGQEDFEVLVQSGGSSVDTYITVQAVKDAGIPDEGSGGPTDLEILAQIEVWQAFLDRACRQWFNPRSATFSVDGNDSNFMPFGVPIISIEYVRLNGAETNLSTDFYRVYSARQLPDDRRNPRIKLIEHQHDRRRDIFSMTYDGRLVFRRGVQNQEIKGVFGFTELDGSVPKLIKRALLKLVVEKLTTPIVPGSGGSGMPSPPPLVSAVIEEWTDGHKKKYGQMTTPNKSGISGITADQEVLDIIKLYKAPIGIATPAHPSIG